MAKVRMLNPYFEEEIKVKEDCKRISDVLGYIEQGNMDFLQLHLLTLFCRAILLLIQWLKEVIKNEQT